MLQRASREADLTVIPSTRIAVPVLVGQSLRSRSKSGANVRFPPNSAGPDGYCERQVWGMGRRRGRRTRAAAVGGFLPFAGTRSGD